jgi:hypothetical protein
MKMNVLNICRVLGWINRRQGGLLIQKQKLSSGYWGIRSLFGYF